MKGIKDNKCKGKEWNTKGKIKLIKSKYVYNKA